MVFVDANTGYFFYIDSDSDFKYTKTSDGGQTWGAPVTIFTGTVIASDVWFDQWTKGDSGTLVHTWYIETGTSDVKYRSLDTASDTLGTERTVFNGASALTGIGAFVSGAKMRGGNLYCAFDIDIGSELGLARSTNGGTNWGARTSPVEATGDWAVLYPGNEADDQDCWLLYFDASTDELTLKMHDDSADSTQNRP